MPLVQRFAQVFGIIYLLVGVLGFVLPLLTGPMPAVWGPFSDYLFGLFAVQFLVPALRVEVTVAYLALAVVLLIANRAQVRSYLPARWVGEPAASPAPES